MFWLKYFNSVEFPSQLCENWLTTKELVRKWTKLFFLKKIDSCAFPLMSAVVSLGCQCAWRAHSRRVGRKARMFIVLFFLLFYFYIYVLMYMNWYVTIIVAVCFKDIRPRFQHWRIFIVGSRRHETAHGSELAERLSSVWEGDARRNWVRCDYHSIAIYNEWNSERLLSITTVCRVNWCVVTACGISRIYLPTTITLRGKKTTTTTRRTKSFSICVVAPSI